MLKWFLPLALLATPAQAQTERVDNAYTLCQASLDDYTGTVSSKKLIPLIKDVELRDQLYIVRVCQIYSEGVLKGVERARTVRDRVHSDGAD